MKKPVLLIVIVGLAALLFYKLLSKKDVKPEMPKDQPLSISKNSGVFNTAFASLMSDYFNLKDALVEWDTIKADQAAFQVARRADSLPVRELKGDTSIIETARSLAARVGGVAKDMVGAKGIEGRRKDFNSLTEEIYNLIRTVRYDGTTIYHIRCPMAFNDSEEGFWLSASNQVVNPYLGRKHPAYGSKMLGCGEVNDSLDFSKK